MKDNLDGATASFKSELSTTTASMDALNKQMTNTEQATKSLFDTMMSKLDNIAASNNNLPNPGNSEQLPNLGGLTDTGMVSGGASQNVMYVTMISYQAGEADVPSTLVPVGFYDYINGASKKGPNELMNAMNDCHPFYENVGDLLNTFDILSCVTREENWKRIPNTHHYIH